MSGRITLRQLSFTGPKDAAAYLPFNEHVTLVFGASNTGKSFACKSIDFMLGSSRDLPQIEQREPYDRVLLALDTPRTAELTLARSISGGALEMFSGIHVAKPEDKAVKTLQAKHNDRNEDNVSNFLLHELDLADKQIAVNEAGQKRGLSFRDVSLYCIVDETSIQAERSPVETGNYTSATAERSVLKLLLTGHDDSALVPVLTQNEFRTSKAAKLQFVDELLQGVEKELADDYPDHEGLTEQEEKLASTLSSVQSELDGVRTSIRGLMDDKRRFSLAAMKLRSRADDIEINLDRFDQLAAVYQSDIQRLEALEEVGFLLALGSDRDCPLCGAGPEVQKHAHGVEEIKAAREAALAEITKIRVQQRDLVATVTALKSEQTKTASQIEEALKALQETETELERFSPAATTTQRRLEELLEARDAVKHGLDLLERRETLRKRRSEFETMRREKREDVPKLRIPTTVSHEFAKEVSALLKAWQFPGDCHVTFDDETYDLRIDGKHRKDNGKGVRAITHAAFKLALMIFCRKRGLPHPGFIIMDSPLLTYRDPLTSPAGQLSEDEEVLKASTLKENFFAQIDTMSQTGQVIIVDNVDPPDNISPEVTLHRFTGRKTVGRGGLL